MQETYPRLTRTDETDRGVLRPQGWKGRFYKLFNAMRFVRKELHLSQDLFMVQTELLEGHIKVGGVIDPGRLSIGFYESSERARLSGRVLAHDRMAISYNGCKWDAFSQAPAYGVAIHFSPALTQRIVSQKAHSFLMSDAREPTGERLSLVSAVSAAGRELSSAIQSGIRLVEEGGCNDDGTMLAWMSDDLSSIASSLIDEATEGASAPMTPGEVNRYDLAREIENMLWKDPVIQGDESGSLSEIARHFDCSPRQIQMALQEHFGVGFIALKRAIRLQQVNAVLSKGAANTDITSTAMDHGFGHAGRFSKYYKEMFGELPSTSLRTGRIDDAR